MRNRRQPRKTLRKVIITLFIGMALAAGGAAAYAGYLYTKANDALDKMSGSQPGGGAEEKADDSRKWRPMTFLLTGIDSREGSGGTMNMDVMMLAALNPETHKMTVVSLPRDMLLKSKHHGRHKANYFFPYFYNQDKSTALQETKRFFSEMFEVPIDYMAVIDFDGFSRTVDELGGLKLDVDMDMRYTDRADGTDINLRKGLQELDGKQTLDFVRYRKSNNGTEESSDLERNARQQQVLEGLLNKLTSLGGISKWGGVLDIAGESVQTDIPANELKQWILSFKKLKPEQIQFEHPGGIWDSPYLLMHQNELEDALRAYRAELGLPADSSSTGDLSKAVGVSGMDTGSKEPDGENGGASSGAGEDNGSGQETDSDESGSRS